MANFVDATELVDEIQADIVIVGSGPAGLSVAARLVNSSIQVVVLESGSLEYTHVAADATDGVQTNVRFEPLLNSRLRQLGGSGNHWGGVSRPLDRIDFQKRDWVPDSGWPIDYDEFFPYALEAGEKIQILPEGDQSENQNFPWGTLEELGNAKTINSNFTNELTYRNSSPHRFQNEIKAIKDSSNVRLIYNCTVTNLRLNENGSRVETAIAKTSSMSELSVKGQRFVLACSGIDTPRLLLSSGNRELGGVGNSNGLVGRYFQQHLHANAIVLPTQPINFGPPLLLDSSVYDLPYEQRIERFRSLYYGKISISDEEQERRQVLNAHGTFFSPYNLAVDNWVDAHDLMESWSVRTPGLKLPGRNTSGESARYFQSVDKLRGNTPVGQNVPSWIHLQWMTEQAPNPLSKVVLSEELDSFGMPRANVDWQFTELDRQTIVKTNEALAGALGALGMGRLRAVDDFLQDGWPSSNYMDGGYHYIGTTRMSGSPEAGVVDTNCQMHELSNVFISGSSVFPTGGAAPPTLNIVALALRLGDYLLDSGQ